MDTEFKQMYEDLTPIIDEELRVAFAIGHFGTTDMPALERISTVASLIADEVVRYILRRPSRFDPMHASEVLRVLDALEAGGLRAGVTGGWGIDALLRRQTREHEDLDLGVPSEAIETAIDILGTLGYLVARNERPARIVLIATDGKVDLHPIVGLPSGAGVQTGFDGQTFEYPPGSLEAEGEIGGRIVRCGTPGLQVTFHRGYEPREHDRRDMAALADAFGLTLGPPYSD